MLENIVLVETLDLLRGLTPQLDLPHEQELSIPNHDRPLRTVSRVKIEE